MSLSGILVSASFSPVMSGVGETMTLKRSRWNHVEAAISSHMTSHPGRKTANDKLYVRSDEERH